MNSSKAVFFSPGSITRESRACGTVGGKVELGENVGRRKYAARKKEEMLEDAEAGTRIYAYERAHGQVKVKPEEIVGVQYVQRSHTRL